MKFSKKKKKVALSDLLGISARGALVRSRLQNIVKMDVPSHFWGGPEQKSGQKKMIHSLWSDTGPILNNSSVRCSILSRALQVGIPKRNQTWIRLFFRCLPQFLEEENKKLDAELSASELHEAVFRQYQHCQLLLR